jgi:hypothetical protein
MSAEQIPVITEPEMVNIILTMKQIRTRMKHPSVKHLDFIHMYDQLGREFNDFFERYTGIFVKIIKGDDLRVLVSALYYKDRISKGLTTEAALADRLATIHIGEDKKKESDIRLKEMKENGTL